MPLGTSTGETFDNAYHYATSKIAPITPDLGQETDVLRTAKSESYPGSGATKQTHVRASNEAGEASNNGSRDITIIRHGATNLNNDDVSVDRIRGWSDIPLSKEGREEAEKLGDKLKKNPPDALVSSDLHRAAETAKIISKKTGVPVAEETEGFRPWNVGDYSGKVSKEAVPELADYAQNKPDEKVPGGESFNDFKGRFLGALSDTLDKHDGHVGIVTHHRGERLMKAWEAKGFPEDGSIDGSIFSQKGDHTGAAVKMQVPQTKIKQAQ